jgi:hypothetical protein
MKKISRRSFVQKVGMGLTAFVPAALVLADVGKAQAERPSKVVQSVRGESSDPLPDVAQDVVFENYATGVVREVTADRIILSTARLGDVELRLTPQSVVWKGDYEGTFPIEVGDNIKAWGQPYDGGRVIDVEKIWVNIINFVGAISSVAATTEGLQFQLFDDRYDLQRLIKFNQRTAVMLPSGEEQAFTDSFIKLSDGQTLRVIGLELQDGSILAARAWVHE